MFFCKRNTCHLLTKLVLGICDKLDHLQETLCIKNSHQGRYGDKLHESTRPSDSYFPRKWAHQVTSTRAFFLGTSTCATFVVSWQFSVVIVTAYHFRNLRAKIILANWKLLWSSKWQKLPEMYKDQKMISLPFNCIHLIIRWTRVTK